MMFSQVFGYPMIQSGWRLHTWVPGQHFPGCSPVSCNCSCSVSLAGSPPFLVFSPYWQTSELNPYPLLLYLHSFLSWSHPGPWLSMPSIPSFLPSFFFFSPALISNLGSRVCCRCPPGSTNGYPKNITFQSYKKWTYFISVSQILLVVISVHISLSDTHLKILGSKESLVVLCSQYRGPGFYSLIRELDPTCPN